MGKRFKDHEVTDRFAQGLIKAGWPEPNNYYKINIKNRLTGKEIKDLMFGKKRSGFSIWSGRQWWKETTKDGKLTFKFRGKTYTGTDWIEGDMFCEQYQKRFKGLINYGFVYRNPDGTKEKMDEYLLHTDIFLQPFSIVD